MENQEELFLEEHGITKNQFYGIDKVEGSLYLEGLTSIPDGFNPTVGGTLYLEGLTSDYTKLNNKIISWEDGKYISADGIFKEVIHRKGNIFKVKSLNSFKETYLVTNGVFHAHGETLKQAKEDLKFKLISEKLKKDPIKKDTVISMMYYRTITGACELGCKEFIRENNLPEKIKAFDLLPFLEKSKPYGYEKFKSLINF